MGGQEGGRRVEKMRAGKVGGSKQAEEKVPDMAQNRTLSIRKVSKISKPFFSRVAYLPLKFYFRNWQTGYLCKIHTLFPKLAPPYFFPIFCYTMFTRFFLLTLSFLFFSAPYKLINSLLLLLSMRIITAVLQGTWKGRERKRKATTKKKGKKSLIN